MKLLLAISGGLDSLCMLHFFANKQSRDLYAAYVNHGIRKSASEDAALIKKKCEEYNIPFYELFINPEIFKRGGSGGFEAIARKARYSLLFELKTKLRIDFLATAHHQNDQAETVFLRIARGTGLKGLRGILPEREDCVIRPMLSFTKQDLLKYAEENKIEWLEDSTNKSTNHFRNKVRLQILPKLESECKGTINRLANIAALSQKAYPKAIKILNSYFNPYLASNAENSIALKHFYLPPAQGYGELFKIWLSSRGISWEETNEDQKFYDKLQKRDSFRFRLGKVRFERKRGVLKIACLC